MIWLNIRYDSTADGVDSFIHWLYLRSMDVGGEALARGWPGWAIRLVLHLTGFHIWHFLRLAEIR